MMHAEDGWVRGGGEGVDGSRRGCNYPPGKGEGEGVIPKECVILDMCCNSSRSV